MDQHERYSRLEGQVSDLEHETADRNGTERGSYIRLLRVLAAISTFGISETLIKAALSGSDYPKNEQ